MLTDACTLVNLTPRSFYTAGNNRSRAQENTAASRSHHSFFYNSSSVPWYNKKY